MPDLPGRPLRVGIGGPVGSGKTALTLALYWLRDKYDIAVVTNDIYTAEDAQFLVRQRGARAGPHHRRGDRRLPAHRDPRGRLDQPRGGRPPQPALPRAGHRLRRVGRRQSPPPSRPSSPDLTIYVIDVSAGDKIPREGGPGITRSDLLVINKIDLAPLVGASLEVMDRDARRMRGDRPFLFSNQKTGQGLRGIIDFAERQGMLAAA